MSRRNPGACLGSKKTPEIRITGRKTALTITGADSELGMAWDSATPSEAKHTTPAATNTISSSQSLGQLSPKNSLPATTTIETWTAALVTALAASAPR